MNYPCEIGERLTIAEHYKFNRETKQYDYEVLQLWEVIEVSPTRIKVKPIFD